MSTKSNNDGRAMKRVGLALVVLALATIANALWVSGKTRDAVVRDGGTIMDTGVVPANVRVEGAGPPIVMIHGFGAAMDWWDGIAPALARDHRVIRIDLIGHGGTAAPAEGYTIERQAAMVAAVLDKLQVDKVTVIAHSMGGEVTAALAELNPSRIERMVLIDAPPTLGTTFTPMTEAFLTPGLGQLLVHFQTDDGLRRGLAQGFAPGYPVPERFVADLKQLTYTGFRNAHEGSIAFRKAKAPWERVATLVPLPPLLAIFGAQDAIVPPDQASFYARVPGSKVVVMDGVGHSPMVEAPEKTLALIREFLPRAP